MSDNDNYWKESLSKRQDARDEVCRLTSILYGFYYRNRELNQTIYEFYSSKRPYGNKNISESIAFNLGWDWARVLCKTQMPDWVEKIAMDLHKRVGDGLDKEEDERIDWITYQQSFVKEDKH